MTAASLDLKAALVVIDLQKGIVALPTITPAVDVVEKASRLAHAFREASLPVVLVNVSGAPPGRTGTPSGGGARPDDWAELVPELGGDGDLLITKRAWSAFQDTQLDAQLKSHGVTQIVLAGIATSIGVESTARSAYDLGYNVLIVTDAVTDLGEETHANSLGRIFPRLAELATTEEVLNLAARA